MSSNRKKHKCLNCSNLIPIRKKYCDRKCYNENHNITITCLNCGVEKSVPKNKQDLKYCSIKCANSGIDRKKSRIKANQTLIEKYGKSNPFEIYGYNNIQRNLNYGDKIAKTIQNKSSEEKQLIKNKISDSLKNKSKEEKQRIREKVENTNLEKFGDKHSLGKNSSLRKTADLNSRKGFLNRLNQWLKSNNLELLDKYKGVKDNEGNIIYYNFKHTLSGNNFIDHVACGRLPIYKDPNETIGISNSEKELQSFLKEITSSEIIFNNRKLVKGFEIDIYIPEYNIAIEFNGLRWHSEAMGKTKEYHINKTNECEKQSIKLIHIFEDEWTYKKDIVKSRIKHLINKSERKVYARKCIIKPIDNKTKNQFLNNNHIQGEDKSKIKYGLYYNDELVSVITFGSLRKITGNTNITDHYELIRFCNKLNISVIGGFSKLLKNFIKENQPKQIISYADRRWSAGNLYEKNNFKFMHDTPPNYWYMKHYNYREHRFKYRKSELPKLLNIYNSSLSEWENMKNNKYDRIWDCGSKKYEMSFIYPL
jgi:hypothetical protein